VRNVKTNYDVRFRVDGHEFRYSLDQKGWAEDSKQRLKAGHAAGWLFDPELRRFLDPAEAREPAADVLRARSGVRAPEVARLGAREPPERTA
jgi:hypothetical protein